MEYTEEIRQKLVAEYEMFQNTKLKIALVGQPGAGKSSLINKILGEKVFAVSPKTDTTKEAEEHEYKHMIITDLPGYGTKMFPVDQWVNQFDVGSYDVYLFVFEGKLTDSDGKLFQYLEEWERDRQHPYFIVRNKADTIWDDDTDVQELKSIIVDDVREKSGLTEARVYFTSCRTGEGIEALKSGIENANIGETKKQKFIFGMRARCREDLDLKYAKGKDVISTYAWAAAANGLNPIPGVDMALDMTIIMKMASDIRENFGLNELAKVDKALQYAGPLANEVAKYASKDAIISFLKSMASRMAIKTGTKYIPFLGQAIAAGISYLVSEKFGEYYLDKCYDLSCVMLDRELQELQKK